MIQERQRQILYAPCSIKKNRLYAPLRGASGGPAASHFRRHRRSGMGNHSRTGSSLNLGYIRHLTDSGIPQNSGIFLLLAEMLLNGGRAQPRADLCQQHKFAQSK